MPEDKQSAKKKKPDKKFLIREFDLEKYTRGLEQDVKQMTKIFQKGAKKRTEGICSNKHNKLGEMPISKIT